ncbi:hypothetical protein ACIQ2D_14115 [Lysinibacillus sp. NPDC097287]|uniref:hypothetical protein n=1 Tax=Lysinibacillus sp. NPDC097287 TaxID=3364144 RepID=UPI0038185C90
MEVQNVKTRTNLGIICIFTITMFITVITSFVAKDSVLHDIIKYLMLVSGVVFSFRAIYIVTKSNISDVKRLAILFHIVKGIYVLGAIYYFLW